MWQWVSSQAAATGSQVRGGILRGGRARDAGGDGQGAGFVRDRQERVWELDLNEHGDRLQEGAIEARTKVAQDGVKLLTVS